MKKKFIASLVDFVITFGVGVFCGVQFGLAGQLVRQAYETEKYRANYELLSDVLNEKVHKRYVDRNLAVYQREVPNESQKTLHRPRLPK